MSLRDEIDMRLGITPAPSTQKNVPRKVPRRTAKHQAYTILEEYLPFASPNNTRLDGRKVWLLRARKLRWRGRREDFLVAIQKEFGLYPLPKWWKVTERLRGQR